jgi:hypothetical protein
MNMHVNAAARGEQNRIVGAVVARLDTKGRPVEWWTAPDLDAASDWVDRMEGQQPGATFQVYEHRMLPAAKRGRIECGASTERAGALGA